MMLSDIQKTIALVAVISAPLALAHLPILEYPSADVARASIFNSEWKSVGIFRIDQGNVTEIVIPMDGKENGRANKT